MTTVVSHARKQDYGDVIYSKCVFYVSCHYPGICFCEMHWNLLQNNFSSSIFQFSGILLSHIFEWLIKSNPKRNYSTVETVAIVADLTCAPL